MEDILYVNKLGSKYSNYHVENSGISTGMTCFVLEFSAWKYISFILTG